MKSKDQHHDCILQREGKFILTDCLTTSAHSGGIPYSGFSWRNRHKSFKGGANAPPIWTQRKDIVMMSTEKQDKPSQSFSKKGHLKKITHSNLACVSPVDDLDSFLSCEAVDINLVWISTAMPLLFRPPVLKLYLIHPLHVCNSKQVNIHI